MISFVKEEFVHQQYQLTLGGGRGEPDWNAQPQLLPHYPAPPPNWRIRICVWCYCMFKFQKHCFGLRILSRGLWACPWGGVGLGRGSPSFLLQPEAQLLGLPLKLWVEEQARQLKTLESHPPALILPMKKQRPLEVMGLASTHWIHGWESGLKSSTPTLSTGLFPQCSRLVFLK